MDWPTIIAAFLGAVGGGYLGTKLGAGDKDEPAPNPGNDNDPSPTGE